MRISMERVYGGRIAVIRFSFDRRNTLTPDRIEHLLETLEQAATISEVRCLVCASDTPGYFSDGFSLAAMFKSEAREMLQRNDYEAYYRVIRCYERLIRCPIPVISYVDGVCQGGGFEWALATDFILATPASQFRLHEVRLGIIPGLGGFGMLDLRVSSGKSQFMLLTGDSVDARSGADAGVVDGVVSSLEEAIELGVQPIARRARSALIRTKSFLNQSGRKLAALHESEEPYIESIRARVMKGRPSAPPRMTRWAL